MAWHVESLATHSNGVLEPDVLTSRATAISRSLLTQRQLEVLTLLHRGSRPNVIAEDLSLSVETVRTTLRDAYRRLGASGAFDALARARAWGLLSDQ